FPLVVERKDRCARRIGRRHAFLRRRNAIVDVGAEAGEIFFDIAKFGDGRAADQIVPEVVVEFSADGVLAFAELEVERFLVFGSEPEVRFHHRDVAGKDFAAVDVIKLGARIIAEWIEPARAKRRIDSLNRFEEGGLAGLVRPDQNRFAFFDIEPAAIANAAIFGDSNALQKHRWARLFVCRSKAKGKGKLRCYAPARFSPKPSHRLTLPLVHPFCSLVFGLPQSGAISLDRLAKTSRPPAVKFAPANR